MLASDLVILMNYVEDDMMAPGNVSNIASVATGLYTMMGSCWCQHVLPDTLSSAHLSYTENADTQHLLRSD